ncbi:xanthine dehydrogenase family Fe-S subunit [Amycolatopsis alkalitolerans]|uniref:2Fe-2S iron-sulfur cluster binding domain-containing protein n=1 Tax=Amycolatopsis alkalitolerans TaxID=2547244 RepID=A0A5C4LS76_9PSEU|nr:2Fe-2S iron-sulfur cluster-binding protein [Amycolatopsis alkalitolerans]TNC20221.1 2Fe-2S iron-sulfur cluster binding domain-containing protein [Amycolatopsis alkalitolerans]
MAELGPVRAEAGELVEVSFTVNGTPATLRLPARVTLSDALRGHLGLTGTHVGCEHGVCGMCTVLVDGEAARACLLFAVQAGGAEITTVEGLGKPGDLHPLQRSFGRNHALQCGFCTPGFLMSSYDLLTTKHGVRPEDLPGELSGVICRCTGYRNIVTAVREVQAEFPDGIPAPGNRATPAAPEPEAAGPVATDIVLPGGAPTIAVEISTGVAVEADRVWTVLDDIHLLARCLPGAELTGDLGGDTYAGRARVSVGPVKLAFQGIARILDHDRASGRMRVLAQGRDTGGAQTQADIVLRTEGAGGTTVLHADAKVYLTGRIAQFGRALAGDISRRMFEQFAAAVAEAASSGHAVPVKPPSALKLMAGTLLRRIRDTLRWGRRRR